ncbi:hypothetical protein G210_3437 [Candida maltosa Xu316]|uniref:BHLH domain-containing protein n=1 Tax=Candida maltosa (strain Xu316) TaxID=1245528 RepID=M3J347_CANMX|nr:hypothetical protein G210_3437 [Candida maltosa Xu316]
MTFKLKDYNAFLTSLFDRNNEHLRKSNQQQQQEQEQQFSSNMTQSNLTNDLNDDASHHQQQQQQRFPVDFDFGLVPPQFIHNINNNSTNPGDTSNQSQHHALSHGKFTLSNGGANGFHNFDYELPSNTEFIAEIGAYDTSKDSTKNHTSSDSTNTNNTTTTTNNNTTTNTNNNSNNHHASPNLDQFSRFNTFDANLEDSIMLEEDNDSPIVFNLHNQDSYNNDLSNSLRNQHPHSLSNADTPLFQDHQTPIPTFASQHQQQQQQQQHQAQQDTQSQHNSNHNTNNSSQQGLNSMGTPLASPLSIDTNNFQRQQLSEKPSSVLDYQNSKSLTEQASKISFGGNPSSVSSTASQPLPLPLPLPLGNTQQSSISNTNIDSPPVSPLNTHNTSKLKSSSTSTSTSISSTTIPPTTKKTKGRKIKVENPTGTSINNSGDNINTINHNPHPGRPRIKSAHNVIEQRYRNKINDKFNALQNSVPTLRILAKKKEREKMMLQQHHQDNSNEDYDSSEDEMMDSKSSSTSNTNLNGNTSLLMGNGNGVNKFDDIDLEGLEPARKLNKGTILAKSIEYIKFLELKNDRMKQEHDELVLKARMLGLVIEDDQL